MAFYTNPLALIHLNKAFQYIRPISILLMPRNPINFSSSFSTLLISHGILHQSTCPHTPQQNGVVERKSRHLVETARTLLLGTNVLIHHLGDAILTACYLVSRMPSFSFFFFGQ